MVRSVSRRLRRLVNFASRCAVVVLTGAALAAPAFAQRPEPFPRPGETKPGPPPATPQPPPPTGQPAPPPTTRPAGEPTEATLGIPVYPSAQFITSYDAGRGQRYYLFGTNADFAQIVTYYRTVLKQRGDLVYDEPPIHMFEVGRFREETMAFPPGVTVKDYTWGGAQGYLVPGADGSAKRFRTVIQLVPPPAGAAR